MQCIILLYYKASVDCAMPLLFRTLSAEAFRVVFV